MFNRKDESLKKARQDKIYRIIRAIKEQREIINDPNASEPAKILANHNIQRIVANRPPLTRLPGEKLRIPGYKDVIMPHPPRPGGIKQTSTDKNATPIPMDTPRPSAYTYHPDLVHFGISKEHWDNNFENHRRFMKLIDNLNRGLYPEIKAKIEAAKQQSKTGAPTATPAAPQAAKAPKQAAQAPTQAAPAQAAQIKQPKLDTPKRSEFHEEFAEYHKLDPHQFKDIWTKMTPEQQKITKDWHAEQIKNPTTSVKAPTEKIQKTLIKLNQLLKRIK